MVARLTGDSPGNEGNLNFHHSATRAQELPGATDEKYKSISKRSEFAYVSKQISAISLHRLWCTKYQKLSFFFSLEHRAMKTYGR